MNVAADEFFNSLADDSDIIRSGPIIKWHIILRYVNAERGKYFFTVTVWNIFNGRSYINLPERFGFIFLGGALTLFDLISGVIPLIIRCRKNKITKLSSIKTQLSIALIQQNKDMVIILLNCQLTSRRLPRCRQM